MTTLSVGHKFTINQVDFSSRVDALLNIQKRRSEVVYRSNTRADNINLAFVRGRTISSDDNISINDRSNGLLENREIELQRPQILRSVTGFTSNTDRLLITNVFTSELPTQAATPLFFLHRLGVELLSDQAYRNVQILDSGFNVLSVSESLIDLSDGKVFNNLSNVYSSESGLFSVFYISYEIVNTLTGTASRHREILNNKTVYRTVQFEDLTPENTIIPGSRVYVIQEALGGLFDVVLPELGTYASKVEPGARLSVLSPPASGPDLPWFCSVTNGKFISTVATSSSTTAVYKYYIPEFDAQAFNPIPPFKLAVDEQGVRVDRRLIKTIHDKVAVDPTEGLYPEAYVYRADGSLRFAITQNPGKQGGSSAVVGKSFASVGFESVDQRTGFLVLSPGFEIADSDTILLSYYFEEDKYEYNLFNLNPLSNTSLLKRTLVIFIRPEPAGQTLTKTLFYLLVDEDGKVISSDYNSDSVEGTFDNGEEMQALIAAGKLWYGRTTFPSWANSGSHDFVTTYCVQGNPNPDSLLLLAEVFVRESTAPYSLAIADIRIRGGGIQEDLLEEAKADDPSVVWNWDLGAWDGRPYPGAASYFIEVPVEVLEECGGRFTPAATREIVLRHTAAGVYPVIWKYNEYEPVITDISYTSSGVYLSFGQCPEDAVLEVWTAPSQAGPWTQSGISFANNPSGNVVVLPSLVPHTTAIVIAGRSPQDDLFCFGGPIND